MAAGSVIQRQTPAPDMTGLLVEQEFRLEKDRL